MTASPSDPFWAGSVPNPAHIPPSSPNGTDPAQIGRTLDRHEVIHPVTR